MIVTILPAGQFQPGSGFYVNSNPDSFMLEIQGYIIVTTAASCRNSHILTIRIDIIDLILQVGSRCAA